MQRNSDATMQLMTPAEYARSRGLHKSTISRQVHAKIIPTVKGKIDPAAADAARERSLDPAKRRKPVKSPSGKPAATEATSAPEQPLAAKGPETFIDARARKESALADLRQQDAAQRRGDLLDRKEVQQAWAEIVLSMRGTLLLMPARLAYKLVGLDAAAIQEIIRKEVYSALTEMSEWEPEAKA
jgi:hypothetical protein